MRWINYLPPFDRTHIKDLLKSTGLDSLENRRRDARVTMFYKIVHGIVAISPEDLDLIPADSRTRATHRHKFRHKASPSKLKFSFVNRTVPEWNSLPACMAEAGSLDIFKAQLADAKCP